MNQENLKLLVGLLGQVPKEEVVENHKLEFVVASDIETAKEKLLKKWKGENIHIDGINYLKTVSLMSI